MKNSFQSICNILKAFLMIILAVEAGLVIMLLVMTRESRYWGIFLLLTIIILSVSVVLVVYVKNNVLNSLREIENKILFMKESDDTGEVEEGGSLLETIEIMFQRESSAKLLKKQAEVEALQSQINPHFLYNTLETIRGQALSYGVVDIAETTKALADIFRYSISKKGQMIFLREEIANIDSYMKIQKTRFGDRFNVFKEIDDDVMEIYVPKLIIQPIVENSIKHGLEHLVEGGTITIKAYRTKRELVISIKDNGSGIEDEKLERINDALRGNINTLSESDAGRHVGLLNVHERIKMLYGDEYGIFVRSLLGTGTEVVITLATAEEEKEKRAI